MKGYKATEDNMKCRDYQYKLGKSYEAKGKISLCENGFHFCEKLEDVYKHYAIGSRVFEIEAEGEIIKGDDKNVCSKITFIRELSYEEKMGNVGICNLGTFNEGNHNTGNYNVGLTNVGEDNWGNGNYGFSNRGDGNVGADNNGCSNKGMDNRGKSNIGFNNTGDWNIGRFNTGDKNIGLFNINGACGFLCQTSKIMVFDEPADITLEELKSYISEIKRAMLGNEYSLERIKEIPNYTDEKWNNLLEAWEKERRKGVEK